MQLPPNSPPPPPQGLGYYQSVPVTRPASISVISIFAIVLGSLVVLCNAIGVLGSVMLLAFSNASFMAAQNQFQTTPMKIVGGVQAIIGLALGGVLLAGGIGGVQARPWARKLLVQWAVADLVFQPLTCAIGLYFAIMVTLPAMQQQMNRQGQGATAFAHGYSIGNVVGMILGTIVLCILPICVLIFWRRPDVVQAFEEPTPPMAG
jgi:hypothetical protein